MTQSQEEYFKTRPKKRMAAGTLWLDENNNLLIGKPSYSDRWSIPGGVVEENESPRAAAMRETLEEIGLVSKDPRLVGVHYLKAQGVKTETIQFYFFGGRLKSSVSYPLPQGSEWLSYKFVSAAEAQRLLTKDLAERVVDWFDAIENNTTHYSES